MSLSMAGDCDARPFSSGSGSGSGNNNMKKSFGEEGREHEGGCSRLKGDMEEGDAKRKGDKWKREGWRLLERVWTN